MFHRTEDITFLLARVNGSERQKSITLDGMCFKTLSEVLPAKNNAVVLGAS